MRRGPELNPSARDEVVTMSSAKQDTTSRPDSCLEPDSCPDEDRWAAFLKGGLAAPEAASLEAHLEGCEACLAVLERLTHTWPHVESSLMRSASATSQPTAVADFRRRLAACPPRSLGVAGRGGEAAIPAPLPLIPGIDGLVAVARGGMGVVYRGRETALGRTVAVKVLGAAGLLSASAKARAKRESLLCARIEHPNVVTVHTAGETDGMPYLVMSWIVGPSLQQRIDGEGTLSPREAAAIAHDLARGLERVHAYGIVHRDLKPDNVLLSTKSDPPTPILIDFGLARTDDASQQLTQVMTVLGTPGYMAPEQTGLDPGLGEVGPATDVHGLGAVLYCMLTGKPPYAAATAMAALQRVAQGELADPSLLGRSVPHDLRTIVLKCLQRSPDRRYRSAGELADDLQRFLEGRPVLARPVGVPERLAKWARRRPLAAAASGLAVVLGVLAFAGTLYHVNELEWANERIGRSRDQADEAMALAERSMDRLTGTAIQQLLLRGEALNSGDQAYLQQLVAEFAAWPLGSDPERSLRFRGLGLQRVADVYASMGQFIEALECQQRELAVIDELALLRPNDSGVLQLRLNVMNRQRYSLYQLGRAEEAVESSRQAIALLEAAGDDLPLPTRRRYLIATKHHLGTFLHEQRRFDEAEELLDEALADLRRLRQEEPQDVHLAIQEVSSLFNTQLCDAEAGRDEKRRQRLEQLVSMAQEALETFSEKRLNFYELLSMGLGLQVNLLIDDGRFPEAVEVCRQQIEVCGEATASTDTIGLIHRKAVEARAQLAFLHGHLEEIQSAADVLNEAISLGESLVAAEPAVFDNAMTLARVLNDRAALGEAIGDSPAVVEHCQRAISLLEPWLTQEKRYPAAETLVASATQRMDALRGQGAER